MKGLFGLLVCLVASSLAQLPSPCPDVFSFEPSKTEKNQWDGVLTLKSDVEKYGVWARLVFDEQPSDLTSSFGEVKGRGDSEYLIKNPSYLLKPHEPLTVHFSVKYADAAKVPSLISARLNARVVCPERKVVHDVLIDREEPKIVYGKDEQASPCPNVFRYQPSSDEKGVLRGTVTLRTDTELYGVWLRLAFDQPITKLETTNFIANTKSKSDTELLVSNREYLLKPEDNVPVEIKATYKEDGPVPKLVAARLNGEVICLDKSANVKFGPEVYDQ